MTSLENLVRLAQPPEERRPAPSLRRLGQALAARERPGPLGQLVGAEQLAPDGRSGNSS
jgi:hypothetical protein